MRWGRWSISSAIENRILHRLRRGLNALTPDDISIKDVEIVAESFDARRNGRSRTYEYRILNRPSPSPFYLNYAWHLHDSLDVRRMRKAIRFLEGEHDFSSFRASGCDAPHPARTVYRYIAGSIGELAGFYDRGHGVLAPYGAQYRGNISRSRAWPSARRNPLPNCWKPGTEPKPGRRRRPMGCF